MGEQQPGAFALVADSAMPQLSYWEQQWVHLTRVLLRVKKRTRRGGMKRYKRSAKYGRNTLHDVLLLYGTPPVSCEVAGPFRDEFSAIGAFSLYQDWIAAIAFSDRLNAPEYSFGF